MSRKSTVNALEFKDHICTALESGADIAAVCWAIAPRNAAMDWLGFETAQRVIFQLYAGNALTERQALICLSELTGAFTGRGAGF